MPARWMAAGWCRAAGELASAWRREHDIYLAEAGKPEVKLGAGMDVALGSNAEGLWAVWTAEGAVEMWAAGKRSQLAEAGAFPAIVRAGDGGMLAAWEENGSIAVKKF